MNKRNALLFGGGVLLGFGLFIVYAKIKTKLGQPKYTDEQIQECTDKLNAVLQTMKPSDLDIDAFKEEYMKKCLEDSVKNGQANN